MDSLQDGAADVESLAVLSRFRVDFHACLAAGRIELCELADAVLCADRPVRDLAGLSLVPEHRGVAMVPCERGEPRPDRYCPAAPVAGRPAVTAVPRTGA